MKVAQIAEAQRIPGRFLEILLGQLKQGGFVSSVRGRQGGYELAHRPKNLTVGAVIRFCDGPITPVECLRDLESCPFRGDCAFQTMWKRVQDALTQVYDGTTFADLVTQGSKTKQQPDFAI